MARMPKPRFKEIESLTHDEAKRRNIPTAEMQSLYEREPAAAPVTLSYPRATPLEPGREARAQPATSTRSWSGAARTSRTGRTSWSTPRRSTSRRRSTPR